MMKKVDTIRSKIFCKIRGQKDLRMINNSLLG